MNSKIYTLLLFLFTFSLSLAQNTVQEHRNQVTKEHMMSTRQTPINALQAPGVTEIANSQEAVEDLVREQFLGGGCVEVRNISYRSAVNGQNMAQIGTFGQSPNMDVGFEEGIILSSGRVLDAEGPNLSDVSTGFNTPGDPNIPASNDAAVIEFEFKPTGDNIAFNYVFASEEYPDYVCSPSNYNDSFKFFIRRVGTTEPLKNIARIPNSFYEVSINNVNDQYDPNQTCPPEDFSQYYIANNSGGTVHNYNGYTVAFTAESEVESCEWYYFRMVIADVGDNAFDSAVFLQANSFSDDSDAAITSQGSMGDDQNGIEGCSDASFTFVRSEDYDINQDLVIDYEISGTAEMGVDYEDIPTSITIPAGEEEYILPINIILDSETEADETITLTATAEEFQCGCQGDLTGGTLIIQDYNQPVTVVEDAFCEGGDYSLPDGSLITEAGNYEISFPREQFPQCDSLVVYELQELLIPQTQAVTISELTCNNDGEAYFNLVEFEDDFITNNSADYVVTYFEDAGLTTEITTPENYLSAPTSVYALVQNNFNSAVCENQQEIALEVVSGNSLTSSVTSCETEEGSAEALFNLSNAVDDISNGDPDIQVSFHENEVDAGADTPGGDNPIQNQDAYLSPETTIYARAEITDTQGNTCFAIGTVDLFIDQKPTEINGSLTSCETENGLASFSFTEFNNQLQAGETISFYATESDAVNEASPLSEPAEIAAGTVFARTDNTNCFSIGEITLTVIDEPTAPYTRLETCQQNGTSTFTLSTLEADIEESGEFTAEFYPTLADAQNGSNEILNADYTTQNEEIFVTITQQTNGCSNIEVIELFTQPLRYIDYGLDVICSGNPYELPNGEIISEPGFYERTFFNAERNCDERFTITINPVEILFTNSFSPNADGKNDTFIAMPNQNCQLAVEDYQLKIFNRWGQIVFESETISEGWNGQFDGRTAGPGTYIWQVTYTYEGENVEQNGTVLLLQ